MGLISNGGWDCQDASRESKREGTMKSAPRRSPFARIAKARHWCELFQIERVLQKCTTERKKRYSLCWYELFLVCWSLIFIHFWKGRQSCCLAGAHLITTVVCTTTISTKCFKMYDINLKVGLRDNVLSTHDYKKMFPYGANNTPDAEGGVLLSLKGNVFSVVTCGQYIIPLIPPLPTL